jgi:hypothetical protein
VIIPVVYAVVKYTIRVCRNGETLHGTCGTRNLYTIVLYDTPFRRWYSSRMLRTQAVVTSGAGRTLWASGPYLVHATAATYNVATRTIIAHVQFSVPAVGRRKRYKSTANQIGVGPDYLAVVTCTWSVPGNTTVIIRNSGSSQASSCQVMWHCVTESLVRRLNFKVLWGVTPWSVV